MLTKLLAPREERKARHPNQPEYFKFKLLALGSGLGDNFAAAALTLCAAEACAALAARRRRA
jgi:hypothetical protein